jgi:hypothetical protein
MIYGGGCVEYQTSVPIQCDRGDVNAVTDVTRDRDEITTVDRAAAGAHSGDLDRYDMFSVGKRAEGEEPDVPWLYVKPLGTEMRPSKGLVTDTVTGPGWAPAGTRTTTWVVVCIQHNEVSTKQKKLRGTKPL